MIQRRSRTPDAGTLQRPWWETFRFLGVTGNGHTQLFRREDVLGPALALKLFAMFQTMLVSLPVKIRFSISTIKIYTRSNERGESLLLWRLTLHIHHCPQWSSHFQLRKEEKHFSQVSPLHNKLQLRARKFQVSEHFLQVQHSLQKKKKKTQQFPAVADGRTCQRLNNHIWTIHRPKAKEQNLRKAVWHTDECYLAIKKHWL